MTRTRFLIVHPALAPYRVDFFNDLVRELSGCHVAFAVRNTDSGTGRSDGDFARLKVPYSLLSFPASLGEGAAWLGLPALLREHDPAVVVASEYSPATAYLAAWSRGDRARRLVIWTDDSPDNARKPGFIRGIRRSGLVRAAAAVICCNGPAQSIYRKLFPGKPVYCSRILQDPGPFREKLAAALPLAGKLAQEPGLAGRKVILFVGRLHPVKNLPSLLRAFAAMAQPHRDAGRLVLVGDGQLRKEMEALAAELGISRDVRFTGEKQGGELLAWYGLGSVSVLPSTNERFGAVVNEALMAGIPTACSKAAGAAELVKPGDNGEVFDPGDAPAIAAALGRLLDRTRPLGTPVLRPDLMRHGYRESVAEFVAALEQTARQE